MKSAVLNRDAFLGHVFGPVGTVDVPELGGKVAIAGISAERADAMQKRKSDDPNALPFNVWATILFVCDNEGQPLFTDADAPALGKIESEVLTRITLEAMRLNGLSKEGQDDAKNDSGATATSDSGTGSPSSSDAQSQS